MKETRAYKAELRATTTEGKSTIDGYAVIWDSLSSYCLQGPRGPFYEKVSKGAFTDSLNDPNCDVVCLYNHDEDDVMGRRSEGTLTVEEDDNGLHFVCSLSDRSYELDLLKSIERKDVKGCSFCMVVSEDDWQQTDEGLLIRTILKAELCDVSPVTNPTYKQTSLSLRSLEALDAYQRDRAWVEITSRKLKLLELS